MLMSGTPVELRVGGQVYRVVASSSEDELKRLAEIVDARLRTLTGAGRQVSPHTLLLAALSLAHDLEEERARRTKLESRSREMLGSLITRIDAAISATAERQEAPEVPAP
jgi:cell division protein ZapA